MKFRFFLLWTLAFQIQLHAATWVTAVRGNQAAVQKANLGGAVRILPKKIEEFANGNTFVRIDADVFGAEVKLYLPNQISANDMMEALTTVFTVKKMGALKVEIILENSNEVIITNLKNEKLRIHPEKWFLAAGATSWTGANGAVRNIKKVTTLASDYPVKTLLYSESETRLVQLETNSTDHRVSALKKSELTGARVRYFTTLSNEVNFDFFKMLATTDQMRRLGAVQIDLITPYLPYSRSDKVDQAGVAVTGRLIANLIEISGATSVSFVRAHAAQSEGFFNIPTKNISGRETLNAYLQTKDISVVVSPDAGFQKDATLYADELKVNVAVINKQRDPLSGQTRILGISGPDIRGKNVVIIDDETASGGTLAKAAQYLKSLGANSVFAAVTHLSGNADLALSCDCLDEIIVTDTIPVKTKHPKLKVLAADPEIMRAIGMHKPSFRCEGLF